MMGLILHNPGCSYTSNSGGKKCGAPAPLVCSIGGAFEVPPYGQAPHATMVFWNIGSTGMTSVFCGLHEEIGRIGKPYPLSQLYNNMSYYYTP
jgi:hypothetical protein